MFNVFDMASRALWLAMRAEGDWWSVERLVEHWEPTFTPFEVEERLEALHRGGFVERRLYELLRSNRPVYSVTANCQALPGLELLQRPASSTHRGHHV